jgi:hypothetical protein
VFPFREQTPNNTNTILLTKKDKYSLDLPSRISGIIEKALLLGKVDGDIITTICSCIDNNTHRWTETKEVKGIKLPFLHYYQKTEYYSAHDFTIHKDKEQGLIAEELISSIESKVPGSDHDLDALKKKAEKYSCRLWYQNYHELQIYLVMKINLSTFLNFIRLMHNTGIEPNNPANFSQEVSLRILSSCFSFIGRSKPTSRNV